MQRAQKDTEAPVGDFQVPEVDAEVVCRQVRGVVAVDGDGVDVVGVCVGEHPPGSGLHHQVHGPKHGHLQDEEQSVGTQGQGPAPGMGGMPSQRPTELWLPVLLPTHS